MLTTTLLSRNDLAKALARSKDDPRTPVLNEIGSLQQEMDDLADLQDQWWRHAAGVAEDARPQGHATEGGGGATA